MRKLGMTYCYSYEEQWQPKNFLVIFRMYDAALDADALMLVTEWKEFRLPSWAVIKKTMEQPLVLDGRNIYDKKDMEEQGFTYHCIGK